MVGQAKLAIYPRGGEDSPRKEYRQERRGTSISKNIDCKNVQYILKKNIKYIILSKILPISSF